MRSLFASSVRTGLSAVLAAVVGLGSGVAAFAEIGYVDLDRVVKGYDKAQVFYADMKVREADIRKQQAEFVRKIELDRNSNSKNPVSNDALAKQLKDRLQASLNEFKDWSTVQQKTLDESIDTTIKSVAKQRNVDVVVNEKIIVTGGVDLTADVVTALNKTK